MAKTTIVINPSSNSVIHDSDGKSSPQAPSVGKPIVAITTPAGKSGGVRGTLIGTSGTHIVFENPAN